MGLYGEGILLCLTVDNVYFEKNRSRYGAGILPSSTVEVGMVHEYYLAPR